MEIRKNVAWVREEKPIIQADGIFAQTITMNPSVVVEGDTIYLFYAGDDESGRRQVRLATAPVSDPENFSFRGIVIRNGETPGCFDYAWCAMPRVVKLPDGTYFMLYCGNCGHGQGLSSFPGTGAAWSKDLIHWEKYESNPVLPVPGEPDYPAVGNGCSGLVCEDLGGNTYKLHLYTSCGLTLGDNVFLDQQKCCNYSTSTDGIHWERHGAVRLRTTANDYENIAVTGGTTLCEDGLWRQWYSAIGTRWGVYSICYSESEDGVHWNRPERFGENLALAPEVRDIGDVRFLPWKTRWQDQSVSYPEVIRFNGSLLMYYCGNDYGVGGIGIAFPAPMRFSLTGKTRGAAKLWLLDGDGPTGVQLFASVSTAQTGILDPGEHMDGITHNASVFFEEFPEKDGKKIFSLRAIVVHQKDGVRFDLFAENRSDIDYDDVCVTVKGLPEGVHLTANDASVCCNGSDYVINMGKLASRSTNCIHTYIR